MPHRLNRAGSIPFTMNLKEHFSKIENFYGEYMLQNDCAVVFSAALDGGFLFGKDAEVYPFGRPESFDACLFAIRHRKNIFFPAVNAEFVKIIKKRFPGLSCRESNFYIATPEGFAGKEKAPARPLRISDAKTIARYWENGEIKYIESRLKLYPAYGIFDGERLVAWVGIHTMTERIAIMGFLHVMLEYRGRGYAESISTKLAHEIFKTGRIAGIHIWSDNTASMQLARKLGFEFVCPHYWFWYERKK